MLEPCSPFKCRFFVFALLNFFDNLFLYILYIEILKVFDAIYNTLIGVHWGDEGKTQLFLVRATSKSASFPYYFFKVS